MLQCRRTSNMIAGRRHMPRPTDRHHDEGTLGGGGVTETRVADPAPVYFQNWLAAGAGKCRAILVPGRGEPAGDSADGAMLRRSTIDRLPASWPVTTIASTPAWLKWVLTVPGMHRHLAHVGWCSGCITGFRRKRWQAGTIIVELRAAYGVATAAGRAPEDRGRSGSWPSGGSPPTAPHRAFWNGTRPTPGQPGRPSADVAGGSCGCPLSAHGRWQCPPTCPAAPMGNMATVTAWHAFPPAVLRYQSPWTLETGHSVQCLSGLGGGSFPCPTRRSPGAGPGGGPAQSGRSSRPEPCNPHLRSGRNPASDGSSHQSRQFYPSAWTIIQGLRDLWAQMRQPTRGLRRNSHPGLCTALAQLPAHLEGLRDATPRPRGSGTARLRS